MKAPVNGRMTRRAGIARGQNDKMHTKSHYCLAKPKREREREKERERERERERETEGEH